MWKKYIKVKSFCHRRDIHRDERQTCKKSRIIIIEMRSKQKMMNYLFASNILMKSF